MFLINCIYEKRKVKGKKYDLTVVKKQKTII